MTSAIPAVLKLYRKLARLPGGKWFFSRAVCFKAPYFASIRPTFDELRPGYCEAHMKNRRRVRNHIDTVHAIAMVNLCELVAGTLSEVTVPTGMRWIPKGMTVEYLRKATTDLRAVCQIRPDVKWEGAFDLPIVVNVLDERNQATVRAVISMWITPKKDQ